MVRIASITLLAALIALIAGCASTGVNTQGDRSRITPEEVQEVASSTNTVYALVQRLRPHWLRKRGRSSIENPSDILVYVDGSRYGTPQDLRNINAENVASLEFLNAAEATNRYGTGHDHGAILVFSKGGNS